MTDAEKIAYLNSIFADDPLVTESALNRSLEDAKDRIMRRRYPFGYSSETTFPAMFDMLQCNLAASIYARTGAEGETAHNENGVSRTYASADMEELLRAVTPMAKVL